MARPVKRTSGRRKSPAAEASPSADRLLAGALELFARRDFATVTIKDIASAAGVTTALIYYYYDNKEALFRAALEHAVGQALENYRRLGESHDDPVDLIADWFDTNVKLSKPIRELVKIMLDYRGSHSQRRVVDRVIKRFYDEECAILSRGIRDGVAAGIFRPVDHDQVARIASTLLDGIMVRSMIHRNYDLARGMGELRSMIWSHLGFDPAAARKRRAPDRRET